MDIVAVLLRALLIFRPMTRNEARMVAAELAPLLIKEVRRAVKETMERDRSDNDTLLNVAEAADFLRKTPRWVQDHRDEIPSVKLGRRRVYSRNELMAYLQRGGC